MAWDPQKCALLNKLDFRMRKKDCWYIFRLVAKVLFFFRWEQVNDNCLI
jgi:hypothetical protein